jgi:hypothetical protein
MPLVRVKFAGCHLPGLPRQSHGSPVLPGYGLGKPEYPTKPFS